MAAVQQILSTYNTINLLAGDVYTLSTRYAGAYYYHVLNLGPANVYIRDDSDPSAGDPASQILPPNTADNSILVPDGPVGLRFAAGPSGQAMITLRLVRG